MSGIAGILYHDGRPVDRPHLERMTAALAHRGPDNSGVWCDGPIGFGHRMLWTTPESLKEKLPQLDSTGRYVITADARIDNRDELCRRLGLSSSDETSDSALILAAYETWGESCPEKLVGDFSFAIWDRRRRILFAARDRIGIKPFYYHHQDGQVFAFASEISPLFQAAGIEKRPNQNAIREFFAVLATAFDNTLFEEIRRLPPASTLVIRDGHLIVQRYWEPLSAQGKREHDLAKHTEEFRHLFLEAVQAQMRSAFPIGCLLGGGLDSSTVLCAASRLIPDTTRITSFSMVFDRLPCDEREFIEQTLKETGVDSVFTVADATPVDGWNGLKTCCGPHPDWPAQGVPMQALWPLLDEARTRQVRVMLTGVGGDAVTQGSPFYLADFLRSGRWVALVKELKRYRFSRHVLWYWMLEPLLPEWAGRLGRGIRDFLKGQTEASFLLDHETQEAWKEQPHLSRACFATISAWHEAAFVANPGTSIALDGWWDTLSHRGNLEFRHPFYDARLVDFLLSVPSDEKRSQGTTKYLLREATEGILPDGIRLRKGKAEFSPLFARALDSMEFNPRSLTLIQCGIVEASRVSRVTEHRSLQPSPLRSLVLWQLAALETWHSIHFNPAGDLT